MIQDQVMRGKDEDTGGERGKGMGLVLVVVVAVLAAGLFTVLRQRGKHHQSLAIPSLIGGSIILIAFFRLPWVGFTGIVGLIQRVAGEMGLPPQLLDAIGDPELAAQLQAVIQTTANITGWRLATAVPTVGEGLRLVLYLILGTAATALISGIVGVTGSSITKKFGLLQIVLGVITAITLLLSLERIRSLGLNLAPVSAMLSTIGWTIASGVWFTLLGLFLSVVGGLLLVNTPSPRSQQRPLFRNAHKRRTRSR